MEADEYRKELIEEVKVVALESRNFEASAFVDVATQLLADAGEISDFEGCHFRGTGSRNRNLAVDGFAFDAADESVRVVVADWDGKATMSTLTQTEAKTVLGRARAFVEESVEGQFYQNLENATEAYALSKELYQRRKHLSRVRVYLVTDKTLSTKARDFPEGRVGEIPVEFHIWDTARFQRVAESLSGHDDIEIDLGSRFSGGVPCIAASLDSDQYKAYLCVIRGDVLANVYDEFGSRLLEGNVRSFLSAKGKINKGIRATIRTEPQMFFAYNNGIAATASEAHVRENGAGLKLIRVKDFQIVNGGQTTASLAAALREGGAALDSIFVQMKLSVVPAERAGEVIPWIARYANSQNKVSDADLSSNRDFHRRLETLSRQIWAPAVGGAQHETHWFYERARGQYLNEQTRLSKSEKKQFVLQNPRNQVLAKTDIAKVENAWQRRPHIVCLGAQKNFLNFSENIQAEWEKSDAPFNRDYFTSMIARAIVFAETERIIPSQPWYQGGYRAQIVAYTIAKLAELIATHGSGKTLDFASIWARQAVSEATRESLVEAASIAHEIIVSPDTGYANVTEWCKREQCWTRVRGAAMTLTARLVNELVMAEPASMPPKKERREDEKIGKILEVVGLGDAYWTRLSAWGQARDLWTTDEMRLLVLAGRKKFVPVDHQAVLLMKLRNRAVADGFVT